MSLFRKAAIFTDIHVGEHLDSEVHNQDCLEFVHWFCDQTVANGCDCIIFMGDWFHNRARTENRTGHYSRDAIEALNDLQLPVFWLLGNHDIYLKNSRAIHALPHLSRYPNIYLVDAIIQIEDVVFAPWLVGDEKDHLATLACKYIFGHFELPFFLMNQVIEKRYDGTGLHPDDFVNCEAVYSGHFHKRQVKLNRNKIPITYIGNPFGHNFNDVNDFLRGMAILTYGETLPEYISWPDAPTYHRYTMSEFVTVLDSENVPNTRSTIEINDDLNLPDEMLVKAKSEIATRGIRIIPKRNIILGDEPASPGKKYASVDAMVEHNLRNLNYDGKFDPNYLVELYMAV